MCLSKKYIFNTTETETHMPADKRKEGKKEVGKNGSKKSQSKLLILRLHKDSLKRNLKFFGMNVAVAAFMKVARDRSNWRSRFIRGIEMLEQRRNEIL